MWCPCSGRLGLEGEVKSWAETDGDNNLGFVKPLPTSRKVTVRTKPAEAKVPKQKQQTAAKQAAKLAKVPEAAATVQATATATGNAGGGSGEYPQFENAIGCRVTVRGYGKGTLKFYGLHVSKKINRCGIEFDEPVGKNSGVVQGHQYFECLTKHGLLTDPEKVTLLSGKKNDVATPLRLKEPKQIRPRSEYDQEFSAPTVVASCVWWWWWCVCVCGGGQP